VRENRGCFALPIFVLKARTEAQGEKIFVGNVKRVEFSDTTLKNKA
jgi:hypothetical protein